MSIMIDDDPTSANDPTAAIARRLREERQRRNWSLDDLAQHSGVSKAMLSRLERSEASPTAVLLGRISGAFGTTLSSLLATDQPRARLVRSADQSVWKDPQTHYTRRQLSPQSDSPIQLVEVELPPRQKVAFPASAYAFIRQVLWVQSGTLEFTEGEQTVRLAPGDCLELGAPADCVFHNPGRSTCRYVVVVARR
jgi:transcriptional regulator with XRE-family HTH domain